MPHMNFQDLQKQLDTSRKNRDRMAENLHTAKLAREAAERALNAAEAKFTEQRATALVEETQLGGTTVEEKRIAGLQSALKARSADVEVAQRALELANDKIQSITDEIQSRRHESCLIADRDLRLEIRRDILALAAKIGKYGEVRSDFGLNDWIDDLYPVDASNRGSMMRDALIRATCTVGYLNSQKWNLPVNEEVWKRSA